jgi:hypothetical protein
MGVLLLDGVPVDRLLVSGCHESRVEQQICAVGSW